MGALLVWFFGFSSSSDPGSFFDPRTVQVDAIHAQDVIDYVLQYALARRKNSRRSSPGGDRGP
eukprot:scaffold7167_cov165-Amphora_coffeaeformis.AAC.8